MIAMPFGMIEDPGGTYFSGRYNEIWIDVVVEARLAGEENNA